MKKIPKKQLKAFLVRYKMGQRGKHKLRGTKRTLGSWDNIRELEEWEQTEGKDQEEWMNQRYITSLDKVQSNINTIRVLMIYLKAHREYLRKKERNLYNRKGEPCSRKTLTNLAQHAQVLAQMRELINKLT